MAKITKKLLNESLATIKAAGELGTFAPAGICEALAANGLVEFDPSVVDASGNVAVRAIADAPKPVATPKAAAPVFEIVKGATRPEKGRRGNSGTTIYPFDSLEVDDSFTVPATEDRPDPTKSLGSTVSAANKRYASPDPSGATRTDKKGNEVPVMVYSRRFAIYRDPRDNSAHIFREA